MGGVRDKQFPHHCLYRNLPAEAYRQLAKLHPDGTLPGASSTELTRIFLTDDYHCEGKQKKTC